MTGDKQKALLMKNGISGFHLPGILASLTLVLAIFIAAGSLEKPSPAKPAFRRSLTPLGRMPQ
ncbi:MAG: hypothetical protein KJ970_02555 [Candidatus Eisenbacteria bacterium]|uniref:Uncharacterized protein n=1 Tax=Eiseniibacteriota bacterium TaxID=2212470 RepID=A0A948RRR2_UNCEI|nr:hypothetical protein [Candidatus Eisenbacteria bacterium]